MDVIQLTIFALSVVLFMALLFLRAVNLNVSQVSQFELHRRVKKEDQQAARALQRQELLNELSSARHILETLVIILLILGLTYSLGWFFGIVTSLVLLLLSYTIAQWSLISRFAQTNYEKYEASIITVIRPLAPYLKVTRGFLVHRPQEGEVYSKSELIDMVEKAKNILSEDERRLLLHALQFDGKMVKDIMVPRSVVETVKDSEVLGPIILDRLHKTGHSRFPVLDSSDANQIVGLLYVHDLVTSAREHKKVTVKKVMDPKVFYINENQSLESALNGFLRTHHHLFMVVNEFEEVTGIVTIEDVIEAVIGRKIIDEFDQYDDLRAVASRAATRKQQASPKSHIS